MSKRPSVLSGALRRPFDEQVRFFRAKLGNRVPTERWDDLKRGQHDIGFMVAGATKADLLTDLGAAVERTVSEGKTIEAFRKDFRDIVQKRGWHGWTGEGSKAGEAWRTRVIYRTNLSTSYAAGRYEQLEKGGYDLWVYKHSGSAEPRPQHLAWDGLTLPKGHPYWRTHAPKNGFGCECYVVGARSERGARRLGGDPDKSLPDGWDAIDPKTGAPAGIDPGWDYRPGRRAQAIRGITEKLGRFDPRLQDMALAMADKTRQWNYEMAKAYMQSLPGDSRDALALAYRSLPSVADDTRRYAQAVLEGRQVAPYRTLGLLTREDISTVGRHTGREVEGYDFALDASAVGHVHKHHGNDKTEAMRGQRGMTTRDYTKMGALLNDPDQVEDAGLSDRGEPLVRFKKRFDGETYSAVFSVRKKRKMLALVSYYIRRKKQ